MLKALAIWFTLLILAVGIGSLYLAIIGNFTVESHASTTANRIEFGVFGITMLLVSGVCFQKIIDNWDWL